jgi:two-component system NarL family response regulator
VLILTDDESEVSIRRAVELGIGGYLPLSSGVESVVHAVRCVNNGGTAIAPNVMTKMAISLRSRPLSEGEIEVLRLIMQGLPDKAIARRLERSVGTAKSHVKAILMKLDASSRVEAVAVARRRGLVPEKSLAMPVS